MLKSIATVLSGTLVAQIIGLAAMPLLSRLYTPEDFGRYQIYVSSLSILLMIVAFRYEVGLLSSNSATSFRTLLALVVRICVVTSAVTGVVLWVARDMIEARFYGIEAVLWLMAPAMFIAGIHHALIYVPIRDRAYRLSASSKIAQSGGYVGSAIGLALGPFSAIGLVAADMVGRISGGAMIIARARHLRADLVSSPSLSALRASAAEHKQFPLRTFPGTLLSALAAAMTPIAFASIFSIQVAGQYALIERVILLPVGVVAFSVGQVVTGDLAASLRERPLAVYADFKRLLKILILIGAPAAVAGFFLLPFAVPLAFGEQWSMAGKLGAWIMPMALSTFVAGPVNMILVVSGHASLQLGWEIGRFLVMALTFLILATAGGVTPEMAMAAIASSAFLSYSVFLFLCQQALARRDKDFRAQTTVERT